MEEVRVRAVLPFSFFDDLLPCNIEIVKGNAMKLRAYGAKLGDGSVLRSKEYIWFRNGQASLLLQRERIVREHMTGVFPAYAVDLIKKTDPREVVYWEVECVSGDVSVQQAEWMLAVSDTPGLERTSMPLISQDGDPGQYFYLVKR